MVANDALTDPRTRELREYLESRGIGAMLDCPVFHQGELVGVVCHEHVGAAREWSKSDIDFVTTVSDMIGLYLEQDATQRAYRDLIDARTELEQSRTMDALGRLAAGVAHDFNNVLGAIGLRTERLVKSEASTTVQRYGDDIEAALAQGSRLARQLLALGDAEPATASTIDFALVCRESSAVLAVVAKDKVSLAFNVAEGPLLVRVDRSRAEQVISNLVMNARDAVGDEGQIRVTLQTAATDGEVEFIVTDNGVGMSEETRERAFEPFFTTKANDTSRGLGLATVYRVVKEVGGRIEIESDLGIGTRFRVTLPVAHP